MSYSKGIFWLDDCRIPFVGSDKTRAGKRTCNIFETEYQSGGNGSPEYETNVLGRFTPNLLVCDDMLNDGSVVKSSNNLSKKTTLQSPYFTDEKQEIHKDTSYGDKGTNSRYYDLDLWFDKMIEKL
jgi:hypothetical protein